MPNQFPTAQAFLEHLQKRYWKYIAVDESDLTYEEMTRETLSRVEYETDKKISREDLLYLKPHMDNLVAIIISALNPKELAKVQETTAVGVIHRGNFNAMCLRSAYDDWCAIVINRGLFLFLNQYLKITSAVISPEKVVYCDQGPPETLSSTHYVQLLHHIVEQYQRYRIPYGPKIKLNAAATAELTLNLLLSELFVLGHEFGHLLNGDLANSHNLKLHDEIADVYMFGEGQNRDLELRADIRAYELMKNGLENSVFRTSHLARPSILYVSLMNLMDAMYCVTFDKGTSHPTTIERVVAIAKHFYGERIAKLSAETFNDPKLLGRLFDELSTIQ